MKGKKLLAGVLSAAMVLGTMVMPVFASDNAAQIGDTTYESIDDALDDANGETVTLLKNVATDKPNLVYSNPTTIALNGYKLTINNPTNEGFYLGGKVTIDGDADRRSTIEMNYTGTKSCESIFAAGSHTATNAEITLRGLTFKAPAAYATGCGLIGAFGGSKLEVNNVKIEAGDGTVANADSCDTIFYGEYFDAGSKLILNDVDITNINSDTFAYGFGEMDIDDVDFKGKINEYLFSCASGSVKNSKFKYTNDETISVVRDANGVYPVNISFADTKIEGIPECTSGKVFDISNANAKIFKAGTTSFTDASENEIVENTITTAAAKIGDNYYTSFAAALAAAQDDDVIDMCGSTVMFKDEFIYGDEGKQYATIGKNITIKNGTIDISGVVTAASNGTIEIQGNTRVTFDGVTIKGEDYDSWNGVFFACDGAVVTLNNCKMNLKGEKNGLGAVLKANGNSTYIINGGEYIWTDTVRGITAAWVEIDGAEITATHTTKSPKSFFRNVFGTIKNSTISADNFDNGIENVLERNKIPTGNEILTVSDNTEIELTNMNNDVILEDLEGQGGHNTKLTIKDTASVTMNTGAFEAKVGDTYYATLKDAHAAASEGATVTLLKDVEMAAETAFNEAITIDLNNHTWKVEADDQQQMNIGQGVNVTFKNGTIDVTGVESQQAVWYFFNNATMTFDNVKLTGTSVVSVGAALFLANSDAVGTALTFKNSYINLGTSRSDVTGKFVMRVNDVTFDDTEASFDEFDGIFNSCKLTIKGTSDVTVKNGNYALNQAQLEMYDSASLKAINCHETAVKLGTISAGKDSYIKLNGTSSLTMVNNKTVDSENNPINQDIDFRREDDGTIEDGVNVSGIEITVAKNAILNAVIHNDVTEQAKVTGKANTVSVEFKQVAGEDKTWNIVLVAPTETFIHEFTTAQLKFACNDEISYEIEAVDPAISVNEQMLGSNIYLFNLKDGENIVADKNEIVIGKVVFGDGYSDASVAFKVDARYENKVTATKGQNQREVFTGDTLTTDDVINAYFKQPICKTTINIATLENTGDNAIAYQDMSVVITSQGLNEEIRSFDLGKDGDYKQDENGNYVIETDLYQENSYIITVSGAGYRTAKHQLRTQDKEAVTINFWANVQLKEDKLAMETNADGDEALAWYNFIAGDIIDDKKLDIFDFAAVVGYFGDEASENDMTGGWNKVKYDLNRDGVIDAEDVAIVLNAWKGLEKLK